MNYAQVISDCEDRKHLISMAPVERIVELGYNTGLDKNKTVLDLCCGYGEMLKLWSEAFGIQGTGVDRSPEFIETGKKRINSKLVTLVCADVLKYSSTEKYDVVVCTELSGGVFSSFEEGIVFLEQFIKPGGTLVFGKLFLKTENPPQELIEFDGELPALNEIWQTIKRSGYHLTAMATGTHVQWENYIMAKAKEAVVHLRQSPDDKQFAAWDDKWYRIYFEQRRRYEGWGLFAIEKI